jgi:hypothetical protein
MNLMLLVAPLAWRRTLPEAKTTVSTDKSPAKVVIFIGAAAALVRTPTKSVTPNGVNVPSKAKIETKLGTAVNEANVNAFDS